MILPGLIDPHVHLRDPGQTEKEDFYTGSSAAVAGGYTTILDMPNNVKPVFTAAALRQKKALAKEKTICNIGFYFGTMGDNLDEFPNAVQLGVFGLKIYLNRTTGDFLMDRKNLERIFTAWPEHLPILLHAEEETFLEALDVIRKYPRKTHLCHLSTRNELEQVIAAKEAGLPITCGVTPHHLFLTRDDEKQLGTYAKMRPPLRPEKDVTFLWKNIAAIDCIESDHAPHTREDKAVPDAPNGIPGLETALPLLLNAVAEGKLELHDIIRLCHDGPAKIFNVRQPKGTFVEVDLQKTYTINENQLFTKSGWTPFHGRKVRGKVIRTFIRDVPVYENGKILVQPGFGTVL
jgi:dihydroorotase-like cyclic amidohydrolase